MDNMDPFALRPPTNHAGEEAGLEDGSLDLDALSMYSDAEDGAQKETTPVAV